MPPPPNTSCGAEKPADKIIIIYHVAAKHIAAKIALGIFFNGRFISSAACGITSKPTNIAGTANTTVNSPDDEVNNGSALETSP